MPEVNITGPITGAELWIVRDDYRNACLEIVGTVDGDRAGADLAT